MREGKIHNNKIVWMALAGWTLFCLLYILSKNLSSDYSAYFPLLGEPGLDAVAVALAFNLYKRCENYTDKKTLFLLSLSFVFSFISDFIYNIVLNFFNFNYKSSVIEALFDVPFAIFLFVQLIMWFCIMLSNKKNIRDRKSYIFYIPSIVLSFLAFIVFMFGISWKVSYFSLVGLFQSIDTLAEVIGFSLAVICLTRAKSRLISFISIGYLIIISSDFIIRYYVVSGYVPYLNPFESTWILGLLLVCLGCYFGLKESDLSLKLLPTNSLQSQIAIWFLVLWVLFIILFIGLNLLLINSQEYREFIPSLLATLVPFSALCIIVGTFLSKKISSALLMLESIISQFTHNTITNISSLKGKVDDINGLVFSLKEDSGEFEIYEVKNLSDFVISHIKGLEVSNRIKTEFLMNMSHDFRTPVSGIYHLSRSVYKRMTDVKLKNLQKLIVDSTRQLINFIDDILCYSKLDNDKFECSIKSIELKPVINDITLFVLAKIHEKNLTFNVAFGDNALNCVGDRLMLHRVILNLISNAIKFTHKGGIIISTKKINAGNNRFVGIRVEDTGIGIDKKYYDYIFEPFARIAPPETAQYTGIGLGLSHVRLMLKKMGGSIIVESTVNVGSAFTIFLPADV